MPVTFTSGEFNQDPSRARAAASRGPVYITDRDRPVHVLLTFEEYQGLAGASGDIIELLGQPAGIEAVDLAIPTSRDLARPQEFH